MSYNITITRPNAKSPITLREIGLALANLDKQELLDYPISEPNVEVVELVAIRVNTEDKVITITVDEQPFPTTPKDLSIPVNKVKTRRKS